MAIPKEHQKYSWADYLSWPEGERWELIEGEAWAMSPAPSRTHQVISGEIFAQLHDFLRNKACRVFIAPFDVKLSAADEDDAPTVVQPDVVLCCDKEKISERGITGPPDLVVEVVSPASGIMDRKLKYGLYEKAGVGEYWLVEPVTKVLEIYRREEGGAQFKRIGAFSSGDTPGVAALPGFELDCEAVFST